MEDGLYGDGVGDKEVSYEVVGIVWIEYFTKVYEGSGVGVEKGF